jgi:hypothetical protein
VKLANNRIWETVNAEVTESSSEEGGKSNETAEQESGEIREPKKAETGELTAEAESEPDKTGAQGAQPDQQSDRAREIEGSVHESNEAQEPEETKAIKPEPVDEQETIDSKKPQSVKRELDPEPIETGKPENAEAREPIVMQISEPNTTIEPKTMKGQEPNETHASTNTEARESSVKQMVEP